MPATIAVDLSPEELERYGRHLILPEVGFAGQRALKVSRVLLIGAGGLGSPAALYLAAAGVGTLGIVDFDAVERTNLQRQVVHSTAEIGQSKAASAARRIEALNPNVRAVVHAQRLGADNALDLLRDYDVIIDGTDNFQARYLVSDACVMLGKPNVHGSVYRFEGQASVFDARRGPCYRCMFPKPPPPGSAPSCADAGVLGVLPGIIGLIQATETIKLVLGLGEPLIGRLLTFDALRMRFRDLKLRKDPRCVACGPDASLTTLVEEDMSCEPSVSADEIAPRELKAKLDRGEPVVLLDVRDPDEISVSKIAGAREVPLAELEARLGELDKQSDVVAYCLSGSRSGRAARQLRAAGFLRVKNLSGGIKAWVDQVDSSLPRYW